MLIKAAYLLAKKEHPNEVLSVILDFNTEWGFLFEKDLKKPRLGNIFTVVSKDGKKVYGMPTTPNNVKKINIGKRIPLTAIK